MGKLESALLSSTEANQSASMSHVTIGKAVCSRIAAAFVATLLVAGPTRADTSRFCKAGLVNRSIRQHGAY